MPRQSVLKNGFRARTANSWWAVKSFRLRAGV
jgi:hypothetical protein